ncbi:NAD(P)-dependent oxidoreductase [Nostoc sp. FACHB-133]|uniref:NAD-dependent epimerase/dehydratase family protein n=1 Tax=Nostoc sp. FACHB-133 TaxID=2692835 RepID=UPI0016869056|nr:NAD(P)-dependent oxidoreductase [Nostoc sp. FACHB-133]MBD2527760.1 NAD(P)-dependent oxidoreductase [Nostoc sp. FACHB-133]
MKIFVAGATGAIGRPLIAQLLANGHNVVALTRSSEKAETLAQQGVESASPSELRFAIADVFDPDSIKAAILQAHPEVVIEQLTAYPKTYTRESMSAATKFNTRIRLEGGANVLAAAQAAGVRRYLRQSIAFWAVPGSGLADEETPLAFDGSPAVAADARVVTELERRLLEQPDLEGIILRYGFFYGSGTWFAPDGDVANQVRQQQFPIVGNGEGVWSWLHIEDAAIATVSAAERGNPGIYLIADNQPLKVREWLPVYARWLNAAPPPQVSVEDAIQIGGADAIYYGTQMRGVLNAKARRELNFQPRSLEWLVKSAAYANESCKEDKR